MKLKKALIVGIVSALLILVTACAPSYTIVEATQEVTEADVTAAEVEESMPEEAEAAEVEEVEAEESMPEEAEAEEVEAQDEPAAPVDVTNPRVDEVMHEVTLVQHSYNPDTGVTSFTCASSGQGLSGVAPDPEGPRFVGANSRDFDLRGTVGLFRVDPDGTISFVPQETGSYFLDPDGTKHESLTLEQALGYFASGDAIWLGEHGDPGRIQACDPTFGEQPAEEAEAAEAEEVVEDEPTAPVDMTNPNVDEVMNAVTLVQHNYNPDTGVTSFTCASSGQGLSGVVSDAEGPRFVGPNSRDFDLRGTVGLFRVDPDGTISFVPQQTGSYFLDPDGIKHTSLTLEQALGYFASGDAVWLGEHGDPGRIQACDPKAG